MCLDAHRYKMGSCPSLNMPSLVKSRLFY
uniref:Uncharacterized protein n=1 Tax=Anguilla anguilla TaxID=7936 RepID=A0A0E9VBA7_ANGAN